MILLINAEPNMVIHMQPEKRSQYIVLMYNTHS